MRDVGLNSFQTADQPNSLASKLSENTYGLAKRYDQNQLSQLLCLGPTWVWETDADHRFSFISPKMEDVTGIKVKDLIGRTRRDSFFGSAGLSPSMIAHLDDLNSQRPFNDFAFRSSKSDGAALWVTISGFPRFDEDGKFLGYTGVSRALSDQAFIDSGLKTI